MNMVMLPACIIMFIMATISWAIHFAIIQRWDRLFVAHLRHDTNLVNIQSEIIASTFRLRIIPLLLTMVNFTLSDAIVVWRAWAVRIASRKLVLMPILLWFGSLGCAVAFLWKGESPKLQETMNNAQFAGFILSFATNATATSLIGYTAWGNRQLLNLNLRRSSVVAKTQNILVLLIESGILYGVFWIMLIVSGFVQVTGSEEYAGTFLMDVGIHIAGVYPTIIMVLVSLKKTIWDLSTLSLDSKRTVLELATVREGSVGSVTVEKSTASATLVDGTTGRQDSGSAVYATA
ncbi:hypothetical protein HETIRDRAFT_446608 [Heterobasidion irregulare TC 32-1]|uniref:Uncharacterized protein n=1 Tax=Heterobasidion irregulare (strain TC 32-1) TaxID=747525 RepID=W4JVI6_HETIT|nr:uncharacterized protein HETIRDRAFT_446608 [Heterobasidion irregulare TC 32-1]ETW76871.1 hypothetical protein HETIRDRAFT_446608 [Heterobasidion irregulare TC 32-1]